MSPTGSDSNPCTQAQPCRTFNRTYRVASPGHTVEVAAGTYGGETMQHDPSKSSQNDVLFRPATGAQVTVNATLDVYASHFEFRNFRVTQVEFYQQVDDVTFRTMVTNGLWMWGPSNISFLGGEITCGFCGYHPILSNGGSGGGATAPRNILFDGVYFHDWHSVSGEHVECLQILGADNVTVRNSTFKYCGTGNGGLGATANLHMAWIGFGPMTRNILIENNFFYPSGNPFAIQMDDYENVDLRYNSISGPVSLYNRSGPGTNLDMIGNIMRKGSCTAENNGVPINWRYNTLQGGTCGPTDQNAAHGFIDANQNLHLVSGAPAINRGDPTYYPSHDLDGQSRPIGGAPDAGADEAG